MNGTATERKQVVSALRRDMKGDYYVTCDDDEFNANAAMAEYNKGIKPPRRVYELPPGGFSQVTFFFTPGMPGYKPVVDIRKIG